MLNVDRIREDFPIFKKYPNLVYLDNAATTHKPQQVVEAVSRFYREFNANVHRGVYNLSREATRLYEEARDVVRKFINGNTWEEVIFVRNATEALNLLAHSLSFNFIEEGDEILITIMEHHSNMLPWIRVAELRKAKVKVAGVTPDGRLDYEHLQSLVTERTKVISLTHVSNVLGTVNDVKRIVKIAKEVGALVVLDGAQSVPHTEVNVRDLDVDFLAFSGHKMLGPMGIGVLWGKKELLEELPPFLLGGDMVKSVSLEVVNGEIKYKAFRWNEVPWKFEAGTSNVADAVGLAEAVTYLRSLSMEQIESHERELVAYAMSRLLEEFGDSISILGPRDVNERGGLLSFTLSDLDPHVIASLLALEDIAVRAGFHCAQPLHEFLGYRRGSLRMSVYIYNSKEDVDRFVEALKRLYAEIKKGKRKAERRALRSKNGSGCIYGE